MVLKSLAFKFEQFAIEGRICPQASDADSAAWRVALNHRFDEDVVTYALDIFGPEATLADLQSVYAHRDEVRRRAAEAAHLLPLCKLSLKAGSCLSDYGQMRSWLIGRGLSPAGWRYLTRGSKDWVKTLAPSLHTRITLAWLNIASQTQESPEPALWLDNRILGTAHLDTQLVDASFPATPAWHDIVRWLRIATRTVAAARSEEARAAILRAVELQAMEFYDDWQQGRAVIPHNATFESVEREIVRQQQIRQAGLEEMARARGLEVAHLRWTVPLDAFQTSQGVQATPLTQADQLVKEGLEMKHCVGADCYIASCLSGSSIIIHLAKDRYRATFEVVKHGKWRAGQLKGPANSSVPSILREGAAEVLERLNQVI